MNPEKEKKLQRILQILTGIVVVFTLTVAISLLDIAPFSSIFHSDAEIPQKQKQISPTQKPAPAPIKKKVRRTITETVKPRPAQSPETLGDEAFLNRNFQKAEAQYELARTIKDAALLRVKYVRSLLAQRKILEAQGFLDEQKDDKSAGLQLYRGILSALLNKPEESRKLLKEVSETKSAEPIDSFFAEKARTILKVYDEWKSTVDGKTEYLQAMLAKSFDEIGEYELAIAMALDAVKTKDDYRDAWVTLGHAYLASEKFLEAESALDKALTLDSKHPEAYFYLSFAKRGLQKWQEAYDNIQKSREYGMPQNSFFESAEAEILYELGKYKEALALYEKALAEDKEGASPDDYIRPIYLMVEVLDRKKDAKILAEKLFSYHPKNAMSYNLLGWTQLSLQNLDEAYENLTKALSMDPTIPAIHYNLGKLAEQENRPEDARKNYEQAFKLASEKGDESIADAARARIQTLQNPLP